MSAVKAKKVKTARSFEKWEVEEYFERLVDDIKYTIGEEIERILWDTIHSAVQSTGDLDRTWEIVNSVVDDAAEAAVKAFAEKLREKIKEQLTR
jgi:hypothetical protein